MNRIERIEIVRDKDYKIIDVDFYFTNFDEPYNVKEFEKGTETRKYLDKIIKIISINE